MYVFADVDMDNVHIYVNMNSTHRLTTCVISHLLLRNCSLYSRHTFCRIRWLRLVGSLKLQVSFAQEPYKRDDILQKRPMILRSLLIVATPYDVYTCIYLYPYTGIYDKYLCMHIINNTVYLLHTIHTHIHIHIQVYIWIQVVVYIYVYGYGYGYVLYTICKRAL